jgi:hypothetical protein
VSTLTAEKGKRKYTDDENRCVPNIVRLFLNVLTTDFFSEYILVDVEMYLDSFRRRRTCTFLYMTKDT